MENPKFDHLELVKRLNKGDKHAFTSLYQAYSKRFYIRILRLVKDSDVADELLQALFMKIWEKHEIVDAEKSFEAYLHVIARNLIYDHFRKIAQQQRLIEELLRQESQDFYPHNERSQDNNAASRIQAALNKLSPQRRKVFYLCKIDGKSYNEVSMLLGISVATVNTHMTKSKQIIREFLMINSQNLFSIIILISSIHNY